MSTLLSHCATTMASPTKLSASRRQGQGSVGTLAGERGGPPAPPSVVTYRHVLSAGSLNPSNPLRVIAHCDVDAAYAQFEAARLGVDSHKIPLAVQQWNGLIAISYAARAFGITRHETIQSAVKKCPHLQLVHVATYASGSDRAEYNEDPRPETHKVSLDPYRRESKKILAIFKETCPNGHVEKASIDESYFDLTIEVRKLMVERYPYLVNYPKDERAMDHALPPPPPINWEDLGYQMPLKGPKKGEKGQGISDQAWEKRITKRGQAGYGPEADETTEEPAPGPSKLGNTLQEDDDAIEDDIETTWTDVALALGAELMARVRKNVVDKLGYTTSAGIASNKTLAKLCSSWRKPNAQTIMRPAAVANFLRELPFQKIRFLGGKLGDAMAAEWESSTVGDLWSIPLEEMQGKFGEESLWVYNVLRGIDYSEVQERVANKTMLASKNVRPTIKKTADAIHWLTILSAELAIRLREAREEVPNLWPRTMVFRYIRAGDVPRSRQAAFPFVRDLQGQHILKIAEKLWNESAGEALDASTSGGRPAEIVTIALGFSQLLAGEAGQKSIEGFFGKGAIAKATSPVEGQQLARSSDQSSSELDITEVTPAPRSTDASGQSKKRKRVTAIEAMFAKQSEKKRASDDYKDVRWTCDRCHRTLREVYAPSDLEDDILAEIAMQALELQKQEHLDMHFAQDLASGDAGPSATASPPSKKSKPNQATSDTKPKKGIQAFFAKKS